MEKLKTRRIIFVIVGGVFLVLVLNFNSLSSAPFFAALNLNPPTGGPFFDNTDNFVLFADRGITLEQGTQISSGDLGSNGKINIQKDNIINGNLFAKEISIDKDTRINGNASFNKLTIKKESEILGATASLVSLPIAQLPSVPDFSIGTQDFRFTGTSTSNVLSPGIYRNITLEKNSRLFLSGGIYNLRKLELKENSTLIYNSSTTINIQFQLKGQNNISILPGNNNLSATDLLINYRGFSKPLKTKEKFLDFFRRLFSKTRPLKDGEEEDDDEINQFLDAQERKDLQKGKIGRPVIFNNDSFLNFKLLAPKANVKIGERTTLRGQVLAKEIKIGRDSILSFDISSSLQPGAEDVITTDAGGQFVVNQILLQLIPGSTFEDANSIVNSINGKIVGVIPSINLYQLLVFSTTATELEAIIQQIDSFQNPKIENVTTNNITSLIQ